MSLLFKSYFILLLFFSAVKAAHSTLKDFFFFLPKRPCGIKLVSCVRQQGIVRRNPPKDDGKECIETDSILSGCHGDAFVRVQSGTVVQLHVA